MFTYTSTLVGPLLPKQKIKIEFPYTGINVTEVSSTCGCSEPTNHPESNKISVVFTAQEIPPQVKAQGKFSITLEKKLKVKYYITDPNQILETTVGFKATITEKH